MQATLDKVMSEESWTIEDDVGNKILSSATGLVNYFVQAMKRCSALTRGQPFFDLYLLFKKYFNRYSTFLSQVLFSFSFSSSVPLKTSFSPSDFLFNLSFQSQKQINTFLLQST